MSFTQQEADNLKLPLALCNEWEEWMQEIWAQTTNVFGKRGLKIKQEDNSVFILDEYQIKIEFVNSRYLDLVADHNGKELLSLWPCGNKEDLVAFVIMIITNHFKNVRNKTTTP